jgi:DNA-binding NarL/FixJ family response regulator
MDTPEQASFTRRAVVVAGSPAVRAGLRALLEQAENWEVVGEIAPGGGPLPVTKVDLVVVNPTGDRVDEVQELDEAFPGAALVVLTSAPGAFAPLILRHASGGAILSPDVTADQLCAAADAARNGMTVLEPAFARTMETGGAPFQRGEGEALTPRELEVLRAMALGLPNKGIALRLGISEHTVKFHVGTILAKLSAASRTEAVMTAARRGLLPL